MSTLRPILAIAVKDLRHLARDKTAAFFVLIFPLIIALLFGAMFSGGGGGGSDGLEIAIFNEDTGEASKKFAQALDDDSAIKVFMVPSMAEGEKGVRLGNYVACLHFKPGFDPQQIFGAGVVIEGVVSPKRTAEAGLLEGKLNQLVFAQMSSIFNDPVASRKMMDNARKSVDSAEMSLPVKLALKTMFGAVDGVSDEVEKNNAKVKAEGSAGAAAGDQAGGVAWQPVKVNLEKLTINAKRTPPSSFAMSFPQGVVWGLMGVVTGFAAGFAAERTRGTLLRLNVSPAPAWVVLAGKALACFLSCLIVQALMLGMAAIPFFKVTFGDPPLIALVCVVTSFSLSGLAMFIAGLSRSEEAAGGLARGVLILLAMIGGGSIPLFFMPPFIRTMSNVSPFKWITQALDGAMWGGFSFAELMLPLGVLVVVGVVGFGVGAWAIGKRRVA
jgi:ABC-2 type transport system permease protein